MGAIASLVGNTADSTLYNVSICIHPCANLSDARCQTTAKQYAAQVISNAMASTNDHLKLTYQSEDSSWSQLYNLYPDKLFDLGLFGDEFYAIQAAWYGRQARESPFAPVSCSRPE